MTLQHRTNLALGEVLSMILDGLPTGKLFECRLVSQSWEEKATRLIRKRTNWSVPFIFSHYHYPTFIRHFRHFHPAPRTLAEFASFLPWSKSQPPFLVSRLALDPTVWGLLELPEVFHFLRVYGVLIKELQVTNYPDYYLGQSGWGENCMLKYTPNLETLVLCSPKRCRGTWTPEATVRHVEYKDDPENRDKTPTFHHLKVVQVIMMESISDISGLHASFLKLVNLLTLAHALQSLHFKGNKSFPLKMIPVLVDVHKVHLLKVDRLDLEVFGLFRNNLEKLIQLETLTSVGTSIHLKVLQLSTDMFFLVDLCVGNRLGGQLKPELTGNWGRMFSCLVELLRKNSKTLDHLILQNAAIYFWKNQKTVGHIPQLHNVSTLTFKRTESSFIRGSLDYVPSTLFDNFPGVYGLDDADEENHAHMSPMFPALAKLVMIGINVYPEWFPFWGEIFPRVKTLHVHPEKTSVDAVIPKIPVMFPALTSLTINIPAPSFAQNFKNLLHAQLLEKLNLIIESQDWRPQENRHNLSALAALLGIMDMPMLETTYRRWEQIRVLIIGENLPTKPSVFEFTALKQLCLELECCDETLRLFFVRFVGQVTASKMADSQVHFTFGTDRRHQNDDVKAFESTIKSYPNLHIAWKEFNVPCPCQV